MTVRIATTSDIGHWFRNDRVFYKGAVQVRRSLVCVGAGRCGERTERCQWQRKRSERVAAVKISSVRRKAAQKFWAPQQDHRPLRRVCGVRKPGSRGMLFWRGFTPYGWYAGCENRARSCSVPGEVSLLCFYRSHSGRARFWMPETMPMAANKVTMEVPP